MRTPPGAITEKDGKFCFMLGVSLSSRDCLAQITGVLPHHLAKMEEFSEQLEMLSRKFWMRKKLKPVIIYYREEKGDQLQNKHYNKGW